MRLSLKELSSLYPNLICDDRNAPLGLRKEHMIMTEETIGQSRLGARVELNRLKSGRS